MNIVSQMCAIAVMFVIMYFYISQKKIILHTSKAFVEVWIAGLLSLFFDIFSLVAIEKFLEISLALAQERLYIKPTASNLVQRIHFLLLSTVI